ncbi:MAG: UPF0175 family protein [Leptospiraceae bacterium]|nr:UPF0175 family protein [Leptospiraceae bacterium]MCP5510878.1 UPF0175 family protein [Leptospiraceae bacterium]
MQISINLPERFSESDLAGLIGEMKLQLALSLFREKRISIAEAMDITGQDINEFLEICRKEGIPIINFSPDDIGKMDFLKEL